MTETSTENTDNTAARQLGAALRGRRLARGMSLRALAARLRLSGHGTLVDYEHGRRIPPEDLIVACERVLDTPEGQLRKLRERALAERAGQQAAVLLAARESGPDRPGTVGDRRVITLPVPGRRSGIVLGAVLLLLAVLGVSVGLAGPWSAAGSAAVRVGFERPADDWVIMYGSQVAQLRITTATAYEGTHSLLMTVTGASASNGYSAVGTTHGLTGLRPGMTITFHLWVPGPQNAGVRFYVQNSHFQQVWAPETAETELHLPAAAGWSTVTWTVPRVDHVHAIGMQVWTQDDTPVLVGLDAINW